ncbi:hypothetical protein ACGFMK_13440 [Amycolatopsis sp. NPDC049252]|uniref:hypothetical protein n=1 Tax=Amycolatopsis sp. NPDC049252 TaxID=3363933 RepID=UPI00371A6009
MNRGSGSNAAMTAQARLVDNGPPTSTAADPLSCTVQSTVPARTTRRVDVSVIGRPGTSA